MNKEIRTRIAPSPTGDPHVGTAYIALFNYVFAKKNSGKFLLRIEDTDQNRSRKDSEDAILKSLKWLGLEWDEGPDIGGSCGPYRQSERKDIYNDHVNILMEKDEAYRCFCTPERLAQLRSTQKGRNTGYDKKCRNISKEDSDKRVQDGEKFIVRLKMPLDGESIMIDRLRGEIKRSYEELDDQVLLKGDGFPTYHLANVVDDHLMGITHVIRAEEWITSTPKHIRLYEAFGWEPPEWIHMPLLRNPDKNKSKISKRKNPVSLKYYEEAGVLPQTLVNFLALMGFSYDDDIEKFNLDEMIERFSIDKISLGSPVFDYNKLIWLNGLYLRDLSPNELLKEIQKVWINEEYFKKIIPLVQERMKTLVDFVDQSSFFLNGNLDYNTKDGLLLLPKKRSVAEMAKMFQNVAEVFDEIQDFTPENIKSSLKDLCEKHEWKLGEVFMPVRIAVTGKKGSPPLFDSIYVIGKERSRHRIRQAALYLKNNPQNN
jgi:glutamyl-tRNA synthetase